VTVSIAEARRRADPLPLPGVPLLHVEDLRVTFPPTAQGAIEAVRGVSFTIRAGEILALVGQSGSGKSVTARALVGLAGARAQVDAGAMTIVSHDGRVIDLLRLGPPAWRAVRGREIGFVLQDALMSLDPLRTVGREIAEPILAHDLPAQIQGGRRGRNASYPRRRSGSGDPSGSIPARTFRRSAATGADRVGIGGSASTPDRR
jgi:ABC-type dipeptide/oligopeptide/nickel transport system ATPase component